MGPGRSRDDDGVALLDDLGGIVRDQRGRVLPGQLLPHSRVYIGHGGQLGVGHAGDGTDVILAPGAGAEDADPHPLHE
jgi:hypothetical protein